MIRGASTREVQRHEVKEWLQTQGATSMIHVFKYWHESIKVLPSGGMGACS